MYLYTGAEYLAFHLRQENHLSSDGSFQAFLFLRSSYHTNYPLARLKPENQAGHNMPEILFLIDEASGLCLLFFFCLWPRNLVYL